jgi:hypothetical protein
VHDPPGFEVRDDLLYDVADLVYLGIEFLLPVRELASGRFLNWRDHIVSDVSLIADSLGGVKREKSAGFAETVIIVTTSGNRIRDPRQAPVNCAGNLDIHPGGLVLPGVQLGVRPPRPARHGRSKIMM